MSITTNSNLLSSGGFYNLPQTGAAKNSSSSNNSTQQANNASNPSLAAYMLDLSPEAKSYMSATASASTGVTSFSLSPQQQEKLDSILQQFKDEPYTQETFNKIQTELQKAGLSPDQLASIQQSKDFSPTQALIDALTGNFSTNPLNQTDATKYDSQKESFLEQLAAKFQKIAGTDDSEL